MDGNNNIVPVAFGVGKSETTDEWTWFLEMLRECIGHPQGLVFVSDRAPSIAAGITAVFPTAHHALCCRHLKMNVKTRDANIKHYKYQFWKTCKAYTPFEFDKHMANLRIKSPAGAQLMDEVGWEKWSRAYFPAVRFNIMTSNSAESVNALSRFARRLPIVPVMEYFREFQQKWYFLRRQKGEQMGEGLTPWAQHKVVKRMGKSATWTVNGIVDGEYYEVQDGYRDAKVKWSEGKCTCYKWQLSGLPCGHAIAVARFRREPDCSHLASLFFHASTYRRTYQDVILPVGPTPTWSSPNNPLPHVYPPLITKKAAGRPKNNDRRPSRGEGPIRRKCSRCGQTGHTRTSCPTPAPSSEPTSRSSVSQRRQSQTSTSLEPHGTLDYDSFDLNVDF